MKPETDKRDLIIEAVFKLISEEGIAAVSARNVAGEAGVALGLVNYYFKDKHNLICQALLKFEEHDLAIVNFESKLAPAAKLKKSLAMVADKKYLSADYLSLRMQLWSLAKVHKDFAKLNTQAHKKYLKGLEDLICAAAPKLSSAECKKRAVEIDLIQNGIWLSALLGVDAQAVKKAVELTKEIALAPAKRAQKY